MKKSKWTKEEEQYLIDHYNDTDFSTLCKEIGRTENSVHVKISRLGVKRSRAWTEDELKYVEEYYGIRSMEHISKKLNRTPKAITRAANLMGMSVSGNCDGIPAADVGELLGVCRSTVLYWCKGDLKSKKCYRYRIIKEKDLCDWMQKHPDRWDATKCDKGFFSRYKWFWEKRNADFQNMIKKRWGDDAV